MKAQKTASNPILRIVTDKVSMKYRPKQLHKLSNESPPTHSQPTPAQSSSILSWFRRPKKSPTKKNDSESTTTGVTDMSKSTSFVENQRAKQSTPLKFLHALSNEYFLIGNQHQLDLIGIGGITSANFVETEYHWSLNLGRPIDLVAIDDKKCNMFVIVSDKQLYIYKYESKKINSLPPLFSKVKLGEKPKFLQVTRDSTITVVYEDKLEIFMVGDGVVRKKCAKKYEFPQTQGKISIMMVPKAFQTILNIFFQETIPESKTFAVWCIQVEFLPAQIKLSPSKKIYDIKISLKETLNIVNYSRQIYIMNLGSEILAMKKGYILDSAQLNRKQSTSRLEYLGNQILLHISKQKVEFYNFSIKMTSKPYRISIYPTDSIVLHKRKRDEQFFNLVQFLGNNFAFFFQKNQEDNMLKNGELQYYFYVTRPIERKEKINALFSPQIFESKEQNLLSDRCDMAEKMGLSIKQIYLQLWNRSKKTTQKDYGYLISTRDYETIQNEIRRKLKKSSMSFKEVKKIEDDCFEMLESTLFSTSCTEETVLQYLSSHFFRRKLDMWKDIHLIQMSELEGSPGFKSQRFMLTIQEYQGLKSLQLKSEIKDLVTIFCEQKKKKAIGNLRLLISHFKFVLRTIYYSILQTIIETAKNQLIHLLQKIPQILPYEYQEGEIFLGGNEGIWSQIDINDWKNSLVADKITTIDNREIVQRIIKGVWFRRHWLSQHDMVIESHPQIEKNWESLRTPHTFYYFIEKIFEHIHNQEVLQRTIGFLQENYHNKFPQKIKGKIFLLYKIYCYLKEKQIAPMKGTETYRFSEFLELQPHELLRHLFLKERSWKGLLLKEIKPLCEKTSQSGTHFFNEGLLLYFSSDLSQVSDLKYILNRINNEKIEFHRRNQEMYEILVEALERKLKIGTDDDIPIQQVLIYIENIPLKVSLSDEQLDDNQSKALQELKSVEKINSQIEVLREAKLGMSVFDILHNSEEVLTLLVKHEVKVSRIMELEGDSEEEIAQVTSITYKKIAKLENTAEEIYEDPNSESIFFTYLTQLCENEKIIKHARHLLQNEYMLECYNETTAENLVLYMYRWKLCGNKIIIQSQSYIKQLLTLIPEDSTLHEYITAELGFAMILSTPEYPVQFPISDYAPTIWDLKDIIDRLTPQKILSIDIEKLHYTIATMQRIVNEEMEESEDEVMKPIVTLHQIYELVVMKLIRDKKLKEVLKPMRKLLGLPIPDKTYNIIYPILYIIEISVDLNSEDKSNILRCISHYFYDYWSLMDIIETLVTRSMNTLQRKEYIQEKVEEGKKKYPGFNIENKIFKSQRIQILREKQNYSENFLAFLEVTTHHLQQPKEEFQKINYATIMIMIHNSPYALAKYINCKDSLNLRFLRSFLSYMIMEDIFDPLAVLELGRRIFLIILYVLREKIPIQMAINEYSALPLDEDIEVEIDVDELKQIEYELKMWKSAEAFKNKKKMLLEEKDKRLKEIKEELQDAKSRFTSEMQKFQKKSPQEEGPVNYPFNDSDDEDEGEKVDVRETAINKFKNLSFKPQQQKQKLLKKQTGNNNLFKSMGGGDFLAQRKMNTNQFTASIRPRLKNMNTLAYGDLYDLERKKSTSERKKENHKVFDDMELKQSDQINFHFMSPEREEELRQNPNSSPEIRMFASSNEQSQQFKSSYHDKMESSNELKVSLPLRDMKGSVSNNSSISNPYQIQIKHVEEQESDEEEVLIKFESVENSPDRKVVNEEMFEEKASVIALQFAKDNEKEEEESLNYSALQEFKEDVIQLRAVVKEFYESGEIRKIIPKLKIISILMQMNKVLPILDLNTLVLDVCMDLERLQIKLSLQIPVDEIFVSEGLFKKFIDKEEYFNFIYPNIRKILDQQNIYKLSKTMGLIFKEMTFQTRIIFDFLCSEIRQNSQVEDFIEVKRLIEKITVLLGKLLIQTLVQNFNELYGALAESKNKDKLLRSICEEVKKKDERKEEKKMFLEKVIERENHFFYKKMMNLLHTEK